MTYIKENIITKLQKLYSPPRNPRAGNKLPALLVEKPLCIGDLLSTCKIFIKRPEKILSFYEKLLSITASLIIFLCWTPSTKPYWKIFLTKETFDFFDCIQNFSDLFMTLISTIPQHSLLIDDKECCLFLSHFFPLFLYGSLLPILKGACNTQNTVCSH